MNTGLHDAVNLAWKLGAVLSGQARSSLLDSYEVERRHAAQIIVNGADSAMMKVISRKMLSRLFFDYVAPVVTRLWQSSRLMAAIAQISWCYEGIATGKRRLSCWDMAPGHRIRDMVLNDGTFLYRHLGKRNWVLVVSGNGPIDHGVAASAGLSANVEVLRLQHSVPGRLGIPFSGAILCRPDGFIVDVFARGERLSFPAQFRETALEM